MDKSQVEDKSAEIIERNIKQAQFYNTPNQQRRFNPIMKAWRFFRRRMYYLMSASCIWEDVFEIHKRWIGDLSGKKVLDLGCYEGNALSNYLADNACEYIGIDLSATALDSLDRHFKKCGIEKAKLQCVDVLSCDFEEREFDLVYAQGVLHHFNPIEPLLKVLNDKMVSGGKIVSLDPLQTSILTSCVRAVYHPFRSDRDWEWPFTRETLDKLKRCFSIVGIQGVIGFSKWAIPVAVVNRDAAVRMAIRLHEKDLVLANKENSHLYRCLQVMMCLEKQ